MLPAQHIYANAVKFLVTRMLTVTIFHSTCIFCVYGMALISQHCSSMYVCTYHFLPVRGAPWCYYITTLYYVVTRFIVECGIARFLCAMHIFNVRASSSPLGYLCAKFCFIRNLKSQHKIKPKLISFKSTITHIPNKLHQFLISSFSVIVQPHTHTHTDTQTAKTTPCFLFYYPACCFTSMHGNQQKLQTQLCNNVEK